MAAYLPEVRSIIRGVLHDDGIDVTPDTRFDDLADWDSMDLIGVIVEVECGYNLTFEPADIEGLFTVGDLLEMISAKRALAVA